MTVRHRHVVVTASPIQRAREHPVVNRRVHLFTHAGIIEFTHAGIIEAHNGVGEWILEAAA